MTTMALGIVQAEAAGPTGASLFWTSQDILVAQAREMIERGELATAEKLLATQVEQADLQVIQARREGIEIIRRFRMDWSLSPADLLGRLQKAIPDLTADDLERWRQAGQTHYRMIDGKLWYFGREPSNIWKLCDEAKQRRAKQQGKDPQAPEPLSAGDRELFVHLEQVIAEAERTGQPAVVPIKHIIHYKLTVKPDRPEAKAGSVVRCWLPLAQAYRQQSDVKVLHTSPADHVVAPNVVDGWPLGGAPQRTIYFEQKVVDPAQPMAFEADFEYTCRAYYPMLDDAKAQPLPADFPAGWIEERPPHIVFSPKLRKTVKEIVGDEQNPLIKARKIFMWIAANIRYAYEQEYTIVPSFSEKMLREHKGDCGIHGMFFITLCRAAGIPARWQSGWETIPNEWNMHDWAEFYVAPWGWLPADPSYGLKNSPNPKIHEFYFGHLDAYRLIVNLDYGSPLHPPKHDLRSEPADFQRGEVEIDGRNLYFDEWSYSFAFEQQMAGEK